METQERSLSPPPPPAPVDSDAVHPIAGDQAPSDSEAPDRIVDCGPADQGSPAGNENAAAPSDADFLRNALLDKIVRQVEYYFSDENLPNDKFLLNQMKKDKEGYVPVIVIASFKKMKKLTKDLSIIEAALRRSSLIVLSSDGKKVKRLQPLPLAEVRDLQTVLVENLPEDHSIDNIRRIFGGVGHIVEVIVRDPQSKEALATLKKPDLAISRKLHALIKYDTVEAAETAVSTLNDENNWSGMRVQLLSRRMAKYTMDGYSQRGRKDAPSEKNEKINGDALEMLHPSKDGLPKEEEKLGDFGGKDGLKRNKTRGRGHPHQPSNDQGYHQPKPSNSQGHGSAPAGSNVVGGITSKLISGPKMPDGTRGFAMGRGRPIAS